MDGEESRAKRKKSTPSKPKKLPGRGQSAKRAVGAPGDAVISPDERYQMIALAAYYRAEQRGFMNGDPLHDWLEAEAEVTTRLRDVEAGKPVS